jgi:hypothetical protein
MIRQKISGILGFPVQGSFQSSISYLDRNGSIDKKKQLEMILALCETVEEMEKKDATTKKSL